MNQVAELLNDAPPALDLIADHFEPRTLRRVIGERLPALKPEIWERALRGPLTNFLSRPGKEFRARLVEASWDLAGGRGRCPQVLAQLVEILHAGSLIVDDIEDDSPLRRGLPALHREVGVPIALNAGNWLYFWSFSLISQLPLEKSVQFDLHRCMSRSLLQCHYGQALDLSVRMSQLSQNEVADVVMASTRLKTGELMALATALGAIAAGADGRVSSALEEFGSDLGVGLQMLDDLGGLVSERRCHKGHEDLINGRPTWPWAWLANTLAKPDFLRLRELAQKVEDGSEHPEMLALQMREALGRRGRIEARHHLRRAFKHLRQQVGPSPAIGRCSLELRRLEQSYE